MIPFTTIMVVTVGVTTAATVVVVRIISPIHIMTSDPLARSYTHMHILTQTQRKI